MKKRILISVSLICCMFVLVSCAKNKPDETQLKVDLTNALNWRKNSQDNFRNEFLAFADCKKQNGMSPSQNDYIIEFTGHLKVIKPFYSIEGTWPLHPTLGYYSPSQAVRLDVGQLLEIKGKASYVLTEKGWKVIKVEAPMITPNNKLEVFSVSQ